MLTELKREAYEATLALADEGLVTLAFGHASAIDRRRGIFAVKPAAVGVSELSARDMVLVDLDGRKVEGRHNPSSDMPTHRHLYRAFRQLGGIAHTRSAHATAFAQAGRPIPHLGTTHSDFFAGDVPVTRKLTELEISGAYEWETGSVIIERFLADDLDPLEYPGVLVNRHAPFTWGQNAAAAVEAAVALELIARLAVLSLELAPRLKPIEPELHFRHFKRRHGA